MAKSCTKKKTHKKTERVSFFYRNIFKTEIKLFHVYVFCCNAAFVYLVFPYINNTVRSAHIVYIFSKMLN